VIELTDDEIPHFDPQTFLPLSAVDFLDDGKEDATYLVAGYPSNLFQEANPATGKPASRPVMHVTQVLSPSPLQRIGFSSDTHIFVRFKKTKVYFEGVKTTAPDPYGISGGPVWRRDESDANGWKLVGMATEWNHQFAGFVILRFKEARALIEHMHPISKFLVLDGFSRTFR
jgi:hypothetical protein